MQVTLLFFGIVTDFVGANSISYELSSQMNVSQLKNDLIEKYPTLKNIDEFAIAVNEAYADDTTTIKNGDTVAIIPPVSGG